MSNFIDWFLGDEETWFLRFFFLFILAILVILSALMFDVIQDVRARHATFACEAKNLQPHRLLFTTTVVCTPRVYGADTVNLRTLQ